MQVPADARGRRGLDYRAVAAVVLCAALPVLIGVLVATRPAPSEPPPAPSTAGHWVYVPGQGVAVHVDGTAKRADASVRVGSASAGSPVLADKEGTYLVDEDRMVLFDRDGITGDTPAPGVAERPVPVQTRDTAYLVYRTAGLVMRLGAEPATVSAGGPLGAPVVSPSGQLWSYRMDSGQLCLLTAEVTLNCPSRVPAGHTGALSVWNGKPGFVDVTANTWQPLSERGAGEPVPLDVSLPANAAVGASAVGGRLAIVDPAEGRMLLVPERGEVITVPLGTGRYGPPVSTGDAVAVVDTDTGTITTFDPTGRRRDEITVAGGGVRLTTGADGRAYADSTDGLQSVVMDTAGTLSTVRTTEEEPPNYRSPEPTSSVSLPPATVTATTTETIPPVPETVTVSVTPTPATTTAGAPPGTSGTTSAPAPPGTTSQPPGPVPGTPSVDVVDATASGPGQATINITVTGDAPVFCHVYFNSVERAATRCEGTMTIVANGLAAGMTYDIYVLGTNAKGTGVPGKRAVLQL